MPCRERDLLLPTSSTRAPGIYGLRYWFRGLHLALPHTKSATRAIICCCLLEVFQSCCSLIESLLMQYLVSRDKTLYMALVRLVFELVASIVGKAITLLQTITGRETHWNIMEILGQSNRYSSDQDPEKGPSRLRCISQAKSQPPMERFPARTQIHGGALIDFGTSLVLHHVRSRPNTVDRCRSQLP